MSNPKQPDQGRNTNHAEQSRPAFDCPQWCEGGHDETDPTEDRFHRSCDYRVSLTKPTPLAADCSEKKASPPCGSLFI